MTIVNKQPIVIDTITSGPNPEEDLPITVSIGWFNNIHIRQPGVCEEHKDDLVVVHPRYIDALCDLLQKAKREIVS